ncbi:MAG TPA: hypothetical protein DEQ47_19160 [Solibacterales bacterium]|nr:hypothetical protein [Bryobacterales bacterium]
MTVQLETSLPSPQAVGTVVGLLGHIENGARGTQVFRYSISEDGGPFRIVRDFSQDAAFAWQPGLYEHEARVRVTARVNETKDTAEAELPYRVVSRVTGSGAVLTPTAHPLVALLSVPACPAGSRVRVAIQRDHDQAVTYTGEEACRGNRSNNVYVAGMRADSAYQLRPEILHGADVAPGAWLAFHTGLLDGRFPPVSTATPRVGSAASEPLIIRSSDRVIASDLEGNVLWYLPTEAFLTRVLPGGDFLVIGDGRNSVNTMRRWQLVREVDLLGNVLRETNIGRVAEQLASRGIQSDCKKGSQQCVSGFHHEVIRLPNGHTLAIAGLERIFPAGTQGAKTNVDVLGDLVIDLDPDFQVAWVWNSFDHMDIKRASLGDEKCKEGAGDDGCTPIFLAPEANGWLHSNSLNYVAASGDILMSIPEQDWVVKLDYKDGKGSGKVLWRLGLDGDFTAKSSDPYPWFSYQHDVKLDAASNTLILFDDGHRRKTKFPAANNRGQVWKLDEAARTATPVLNADMGVYSMAVGSAQALSSGGYSFEAGMLHPPDMASRSIETSADGKVTYAQQVNGGYTYRSFRVANLYSAPDK